MTGLKTLSKLYYLVRCLNSSNKLFEDLPKSEVPIDVLEGIIEYVFKKITRLEIITKRDIRQIHETIKKASKKRVRLATCSETGKSCCT